MPAGRGGVSREPADTPWAAFEEDGCGGSGDGPAAALPLLNASATGWG